MRQEFCDVEFQLIGAIHIHREPSGLLSEYVYRLPRRVQQNPHAAGPFCRFELPSAPSSEGVYAIVVGTELKYIGECTDLARRFGPRGYGHVTARNCHRDGQATNCKVNARVLAAAKVGQLVEVWFNATSDRKRLESTLIAKLSPPWNGALRAPTTARRSVVKRRNPRAATFGADRDVFRNALQNLLLAARRSGVSSVQVRASDLHRNVGGYPGPSHQMPTCCAVMRSEMKPGDRVVAAPPKGAGASLVIEYFLQRPDAVAV